MERHGIRCDGGMSMSVSHFSGSEPPEPPVRRRVLPAQDLDEEKTSDITILIRFLNLLAAVWVVMLLVSATVLVVFALFTPRVAFFSSPGARDAEIQSIKSVTDVGLLQNKAVLDVSEGSASSATATFLCHLALYTFLFMILGSTGGVLLIRWLKRRLVPVEEEDPDTDTAPSEQSGPLRL